MLTLELFNAVVAKPHKNYTEPYISQEGFLIESGALWAKDQILDHYSQKRLNGQELNKTFHKSWEKVRSSTRFELYLEQIRHYLSTYGSDFQDEIYIPAEELRLPKMCAVNFKVIRALSKEELIERCLKVLSSGIALKEETLQNLMELLTDELDYQFTGTEEIRNKEAVAYIATHYDVYPSSPTEFLRCIVHAATQETLLIKNRDLCDKIKASSYNPAPKFKKFGLEKLASIFNRFKPIFLAFKPRCSSTINRISKLSKRYHEAMPTNPLSKVTSRRLVKNDKGWLENATTFALLRALTSCHEYAQNKSVAMYRIRNGKSYTKAYTKSGRNVNGICSHNTNVIYDELRTRIQVPEKVYIPKGIEYAVPTSEKMFVGNIPTGTKVSAKRLAVGIYWEDAWGARDLDLSGINVSGKVGWNASYNRGDLTYSGDMTSAPNGAVEYLYASKNMNDNTLVTFNVYSGKYDSRYRIVVGKGDKVTQSYMMNPNKVLFQTDGQCVQKQMAIGLFLAPEKKSDKQSFVVMEAGLGSLRVSNAGARSQDNIKALVEKWRNPLTLRAVLSALGSTFVNDPEEADLDLSLENLEKDTFTSLFERQEVSV